jgi:hypothetical protein
MDEQCRAKTLEEILDDESSDEFRSEHHPVSERFDSDSGEKQIIPKKRSIIPSNL